jgi:hypothetical protein
LTIGKTMFEKTIELSATRQEFRFSCGRKEVRFRPVVYLSSDRKIVAIGDAPATGSGAVAARIFEDERVDDSLALLAAMMRYGLWHVLGRLRIGRLTIRISVGEDIRQGLKGFAPSLFHDAARKAGAATVVMV